MTAIDIYVLEPDAPDDTSEFEQLLETGEIAPSNVVAILGKTEGNGCVNDFSRGLATMAYERVLAAHLGVVPSDVEDHVALIMSGGTEGVMTPHVTVFVQRESEQTSTDDKRLSAGRASTREFAPEEIGQLTQLRETASAVQRAMNAADVADGSDVHYVQVKCPLLTADSIAAARGRGESVVISDTYESMAYSRGASALGVALATGELSEETVEETEICGTPSVYSKVVSASAGSELQRAEVLLLGNSTSAESDFVISHAVMEDALDAEAVERAAAGAGVSLSAANGDIVNVFAKAQASDDGTIRGRRHVIHDDSDINATRHARAVVSSVVGATTGDPLSYVSGGAEHQGPDGGGPLALIANIRQ
jgi:cyanuric acid amidohydrolase